LLATLDHVIALTWVEEWSSVDVVLVDAADEKVSGDQFPGVRVVRHIRACQHDRRAVIVVITGHFLNDGLRHRMADADADLFFLRSDIRSFTTLREVVLRPERFRRGVPPVTDPGARTALGVTDRSDVEHLVRYVDDNELGEVLDANGSGRPDPRNRRWVRHRRGMAEAARIAPMNLTTGSGPSRKQLSPSLRQLAHVYRWATKAPSPDSATPTDDLE